MQLDGGVWDVYDFDPVDQITQVKYSASSSSGTLPQRTVGYDWDPVGNRTQVQSIETNGPVTTTSYATANAVNQYPSVNGSPLGYDANGNLTSAAVGGVFDPASPSAALAYDAQNRLTSITATPGGGGNPALSLTQVHDSRNRVIARTINGVTTLFVWDDWDLIEERDLSGSLIRRHVHGAAIDEIIMSVDANGARYHHHDALGSVTALTDETGTVVESYTYDVFGQPTVFDAAGIPQPASSVGNRFLYTGREWIAEAGLYDYRNRHYSPILGRFLQTDPIRFDAGDVNLYRYVGNSVLYWRDPSGLIWPFLAPLLAGGGGAATAGTATAAAGTATAGGLTAGGAATAVGGGLLAGWGLAELWDSLFSESESADTSPEFTDCPTNKPPFTGTPGTTVRGGTGSRTYGDDGYPLIDRDTPHPDEGPPGNEDHSHDWGRPPGGGPPTHQDRSLPRSPQPGDPPLPRGPNVPPPAK